jgi:hypothetical protein
MVVPNRIGIGEQLDRIKRGLVTDLGGTAQQQQCPLNRAEFGAVDHFKPAALQLGEVFIGEIKRDEFAPAIAEAIAIGANAVALVQLAAVTGGVADDDFPAHRLLIDRLTGIIDITAIISNVVIAAIIIAASATARSAVIAAGAIIIAATIGAAVIVAAGSGAAIIIITASAGASIVVTTSASTAIVAAGAVIIAASIVAAGAVIIAASIVAAGVVAAGVITASIIATRVITTAYVIAARIIAPGIFAARIKVVRIIDIVVTVVVAIIIVIIAVPASVLRGERGVHDKGHRGQRQAQHQQICKDDPELHGRVPVPPDIKPRRMIRSCIFRDTKRGVLLFR